ncbi:hypothetical protein [Nocardia yunnanensis]|uniref:hypothetical protein n=1 Tax=Nocardia yunnanensis TaxID=2382165 RepID=UPI001656FDB2|nr:hypothetical protein [Nocardia yunnanensis]
MRSSRLGKEQLQSNFDFMLSEVSAGRGFLSSSGLDDETKHALRAIARAYPNVTDELVRAAYAAFAGQLDGSNAARWLAESDRDLREREQRSKARGGPAGKTAPSETESADGESCS